MDDIKQLLLDIETSTYIICKSKDKSEIARERNNILLCIDKINDIVQA